jgi:hypothetical protein
MHTCLHTCIHVFHNVHSAQKIVLRQWSPTAPTKSKKFKTRCPRQIWLLSGTHTHTHTHTRQNISVGRLKHTHWCNDAQHHLQRARCPRLKCHLASARTRQNIFCCPTKRNSKRQDDIGRDDCISPYTDTWLHTHQNALPAYHHIHIHMTAYTPKCTAYHRVPYTPNALHITM